MKRSYALASAVLLATAANADPLLTISCDPPKGTTVAYGVNGTEYAESEVKHVPPPRPALRGPEPDGFSARFSLVVSPTGHEATVVWEDPNGKEEPHSESGTVLTLSEDRITIVTPQMPYASVLSASPIRIFSFFPKFGSAFLAQQSWDLYHDTRQMALATRCRFSGDLKRLPLFLAPFGMPD